MGTELLKQKYNQGSAETSAHTVDNELFSKPSRNFPASVIEKIIGEKSQFQQQYKMVTNWQLKFDLAYSLIQDGRLSPEDQIALMNDFIPSKDTISNFDLSNRLEFDEEIERVANRFKESLSLILLQKGIINPESAEAEVAKKSIVDKFEKNKEMDDLVQDGMPPEIIGQIIALENFTEITDDKKMEELRSWATHAILRPYLGKLSGERPIFELSMIDILDRIPKRVFTNPYAIKYNLVEHYLEGKMMQKITDSGGEQGIKALEKMMPAISDQEKRQFIERVYERIFDIATYPTEEKFKDPILVKGQEKPFPSFEQRAFCYDFIYHNTRFLCADTGLGKTNAFYLAMEKKLELMAKQNQFGNVLVLAPASGKETWRI